VSDASVLLTFLFTDIEGSVPLWERDPQRMPVLLERHREIVAACVREHGGVLVRERGEGDSTFSTYVQPTDAADADAAIQRAVYAEPWPDGLTIRVRAALHTGTAYAAADGPLDYNSPTVNRCARLRALAHGGQTLLSETTFQLLCDMLPVVPARDLGLHKLKDLRRPEHVYQLLYPPVPDDFPPLISADGVLGNLPPPSGRFIGRTAELTAIGRCLKQSRLVTLVGMGGIGKTRLALEAASGRAGEYPDGVWLADLTGETGGSPVEAMLSVLRLRVDAGQTPEEALALALAPRRSLVILDGCERLRSECARLADWLLPRCPHLTLLATCQAPLGAGGEAVITVGPMSVPPTPTPAPAVLADSDSVALFLDRAQAVSPDFVLTPRTAETVAEICRRVDGLPLALELAAACLSFLGAAKLAQRLSDPFPVFDGVTEGEGAPRRSLIGVLDSSYQLLTSEQQGLLRRLSVFEGDWTLEAAEAVCEAVSEAGTVLSSLAHLVRRSLVTKRDDDGVVRYRLTRIVRLYARRRLDEAGEAPDVLRGHWDYFAALAHQATVGMAGDEAGDWLDLLEGERTDMAAALRRAADTAPEDGLSAATALYPFWSLRGHARLGRELITALLVRIGPDPATPEASAAVARACTALGALAWGQGDDAGAREAFDRALAIREGLGDRRGVADLTNNVGILAWDQGRFAEAEEQFMRSFHVLEDLGDTGGLAAVCANLGWLCCDMSDLDRAATMFARGLALDRRQQDLSGIAHGLDGEGEVALRRGDLSRATMLREESLKLRRQVQDRIGVAESLEGLAAVRAASGDALRAAILLGAAERQRELWEAPLPPRQRVARERLTVGLRAALPQSYHDAWTHGYGLNWEQAAQAALGADLDSPPAYSPESPLISSAHTALV
jgi:predicted ATPase/class 3 adenylate cyclase